MLLFFFFLVITFWKKSTTRAHIYSFYRVIKDLSHSTEKQKALFWTIMKKKNVPLMPFPIIEGTFSVLLRTHCQVYDLINSNSGSEFWGTRK